MMSPVSPSAVATQQQQQQLRVSPLADIAADPATFLAARTARAMLGRDVAPCVVHVLNALLHAVVRAVVLAATQSTGPTAPLAENHVIEALTALAPIEAVISAAVAAASPTSSSAAPLLPAQVTGNAIADLIVEQAQAAGCYDHPSPPAPQAVVVLNAALDVVAGLLLDSLAVTFDAPRSNRVSIESVIRAINSHPDLAHVVRNVGWLEVLELLADEHDDDDDVEAVAPQFMFPTLLAGAGGSGAPDSPMYRSAAGGPPVPAPIVVDPSVPSPVIRSPGMSARHPPLPSPGPTGSGTLGRLPKGVKPGPLDDFDELLISSETKKITLTPKRLRVVEAGGSMSATRAPPAGLSNISTTSLPTVSSSSSSSSNMATTPTLPSSATFTSLPMPPTRSPPFSPSTSSRPIVSNPSATWELAEFLSTTEPPTALSATSPASVSSKSSKSSRSSGFFGKKFASSKSQPTLSASSPSPPPPVPTSVVPERLPPGHPKYVMLPGADQVLLQFGGGGQSDTPSGPPTPMPQARRRSQAKPSEPDPASSTVSTSMAAAMPPVPSPPPPASSTFVTSNSPQLSTKSASSSSGASKRRSHSPGHMSTVSATLPEGSSVAARMRATLAAAMADADAATSAKLQQGVARSSSSASAARASMMRAVSPSSGRKYASLPRSSRANGDASERGRGASPVPAGAVGESLAQSQSGGEEARGRNVGGVGDEQRAPRRSSSVTRDRPVTVLGPRGVSPARVPVQKTSRGVSPVRQQVVSVDEPTSSSAPPATPAMVAPAAEPTPTPTPTPTLTTSGTMPPAPPSPLPTLPPLPDSLSDLSRTDLERLVRLLHADAAASRHVADDARAAEAAHKAQLDKLAVRAFKTITDLRKRDVERDAEMEAVKREREEVGTRLGQVLAVLGGVVPGLVPEEVAGEGVVRSQS